jgi:hypothetical protein
MARVTVYSVPVERGYYTSAGGIIKVPPKQENQAKKDSIPSRG